MSAFDRAIAILNKCFRDDEVRLVYEEKGRILSMSAKRSGAAEILEYYPERVIGAYDKRCLPEWLEADLEGL